MINIVIPMAGEGKRFKDKGYLVPKPFLRVVGNPMIDLVMSNVRPLEPHRYILIHREEHSELLEKYGFYNRENIHLLALKEKTEGAACTVLKAKQFLKPTDPLLIVNSDQYIIWNNREKVVKQPSSYLRDIMWKESNSIQDMINHARLNLLEASMATFKAEETKWSYARTEYDHFGVELVKEVAEKKVISNNATCGVYYFGAAKYFTEAAEEMIAVNDRVNGEFYVCPAFNRMITQPFLRIGHYPVKKMYGLGTPEDFESFPYYSERANERRVLNNSI